MKYIIALLFLVMSTYSYGLTIEDIIKLTKAEVGEEIILSVISVSEGKLDLKTEDIIRLKKEGVSSKVISALIYSGKGKAEDKQQAPEPVKVAEPKKVEKKVVVKRQEVADVENIVEERASVENEMSPFDQFFLSTYYSSQYGWPERNYDSPSDILRQGLYYQAPVEYPNSRYVRVRGAGWSVAPGVPFGLTYSPFSVIVPRRQYRHNHPHCYNK